MPLDQNDIRELREELRREHEKVITVAKLRRWLAMLRDDARVLVCLHDPELDRDVFGNIREVGNDMLNVVYLYGELDDIVAYSEDAATTGPQPPNQS
jgi:hypothetical protein